MSTIPKRLSLGQAFMGLSLPVYWVTECLQDRRGIYGETRERET